MKNIISIISLFFLPLTTVKASASLILSGSGYITQNKNWNISDETGYTFSVNNANGFFGKNALLINFSKTGFTDVWTLDLSAPSGQILGILTYTDVGPFPFQLPTQAGMLLAGDGRGGETGLSSTFTINNIQWSSDGELINLSVDFYHWSLGFPPSITNGSIRVDRAIPEPGAPLLLFSSTILLFLRRRRR